MEILSVGYDFRHNNNFKLLRPNGLNEYLLLIIRSKAVFKIDEATFKVSPDSMILVDKNKPHSFYADNDTFINDWITFDLTENEYNIFIENNIKINTFFNSCNVTFCSDVIKLMQDEAKCAGTYKNANMRSLFDVIINKLKDTSQYLNFDKKYYTEFEKIRNNIYRHPQKEYTIEQLSKKANLSKPYFQHLYKLYFNTTPISDVINSRVEYAKQLLTSTECSISKISELCGYKDNAQFIKQFKSLTSTTPHKFRKGIFP